MRVPGLILLLGVGLYGSALLRIPSSALALGWSVAFALWAGGAVLLAFLQPRVERWLLAWLLAMLCLPKRDPSADYVSLLNFSWPQTLMPVTEAILFVLALAVGVAAWRQPPVARPAGLRIPLQLIGGGFVGVALIGIALNFRNRELMPLYYSADTFARACARVLRAGAEGAVILALTRVAWDRKFAREFAIVCGIGLILALIEFWGWRLHVLPQAGYLTDFRGGFRSAIHGYGAGLMMTQVWIFFLAAFFLLQKWPAFWLAVLTAPVAGFVSYSRTVALAIAATVVLLLLARWPRRTMLVSGVALVLAVVAGVGGMSLARMSARLSQQKGAEYWSLQSLDSRFDLARLSFAAWKKSPVLGIGPNALTSYSVYGILDHSVPETAFTTSLVHEFETVQVGQRQFDSHNLGVALLTESGVAGAVILVGFAALGCYCAREAWRRRNFWMAPFVASLTFALSYFSMADPYILSLLCLLPIVAAGQEDAESASAAHPLPDAPIDAASPGL